MEKGLAQGIEKGMEKGLAQGIEHANIENAKRMIALGIDFEVISQATTLSLEKIRLLSLK